MMKKIISIQIYIFFFAYLLNLFWEISHSLLFQWNPPISYYIPHILFTTFGDAVVILLMYWAAVLINRNLKWILNPQRRDYAVILGLGFSFAVLNEMASIYFGKWSYNALMPIIPILNVGLTPILQMLILPLFSFWLVKSQLKDVK